MPRLIARLTLAAATTAIALTSLAAWAEPGYLLVIGRTLDRQKVMAYSATLPPIYAESGGKYIGIGRPGGGVTCLHGLCQGRSVVVATWADVKAVTQFWWGEKYRKVVPLRDGAGVFTVVGITGVDGVTAYPGGALLIATATGNDDADLKKWTDAAVSSGARLLSPLTTTAVAPLEGDALYSRVALLSFDSKDKRDAYAAGGLTQEFAKKALGSTLIAIVAVDAPPPLATVPATTKN
jgi:uncharacterized protein (DUF1330 family)